MLGDRVLEPVGYKLGVYGIPTTGIDEKNGLAVGDIVMSNIHKWYATVVGVGNEEFQVYVPSEKRVIKFYWSELYDLDSNGSIIKVSNNLRNK